MDDFIKTLRAAKHFKTVSDPLALEDCEAEVTFVGRSNVGKSSLINAVCHKKDMAMASNVPGTTRYVHVYEAGTGRWLVDLPGYGYAVGPVDEKEMLAPMVEGYLDDRNSLSMVFVVIDIVAGPTKLDISMIDWLFYGSFPFSFVINKIDKVSSLKLDARKQEIAAAISIYKKDIFWVSSKTNAGISVLQEAIARSLEL